MARCTAGRAGVAPSRDPLLYSVTDAAHALGIGRTTMWRMVQNGEVPVVRVGRRVLVPREALETLARSESDPSV